MGERLLHSRMSCLFLVLTLLLTIGIVEFLHFRNSLLNVSAVEATGAIGIYWDENCTERVYSIDWGDLSPGQIKKVTVYVRNEGNESICLVETSINWNPTTASQYLNFSWRYHENKIEAGEVVNVTQILLVSLYTRGISVFSFDIVFEGVEYFLGDINRDGVVDGKDIAIVAKAYDSNPQNPRWNPDADLNKDGVIDGRDFALVAKDYGKAW